MQASLDTPDQHPGLESPIKESSEQQGIAPALDEVDRLIPIGKPGVRVGDSRTLTDDERNEWIRELAYSLWEHAGRPEGRDAEHWEQAISDYDARDGAANVGSPETSRDT